MNLTKKQQSVYETILSFMKCHSHDEVTAMERMLQRYIGQKVEMMYMDRYGKISQRYIEIRSIKENLVRAYCLTQKGPRVFRMENILAVVPVKKWSV